MRYFLWMGAVAGLVLGITSGANAGVITFSMSGGTTTAGHNPSTVTLDPVVAQMYTLTDGVPFTTNIQTGTFVFGGTSFSFGAFTISQPTVTIIDGVNTDMHSISQTGAVNPSSFDVLNASTLTTFNLGAGTTVDFTALGVANMEANNVSPNTFQFTQQGTFVLHSSSASVPEPASLTLMGIGAVGAVIAARRRKRKAAAEGMLPVIG